MDELILRKKVKLWQNRLLDLSKRNKMISFKDTGMQALRLTDPGFDELFARLVEQKKTITIKRPVDRTEDSRVHAVLRLLQLMGEKVNATKGEIASSRSPETNVKVLKNLKRNTDLALQEKGTNILFLTFGQLIWRDRDTREGEWLKAPLIIVPASLSQPKLTEPFAVARTEEDILVNPTFAFFLQANYGLRFPELKAPDSLQDVQKFFNETDALVSGMGWHVERQVHVATMSFLKTNMYNDLVENEEKIMRHPIIRAFAGIKSEGTTLDENTIDFRHDESPVEAIYEILNADSSQKDAVELSRRGTSFVMQGPPGTGKSQTIANIIAQGIAEGKKILFVSEKQAALEVVYQRLRSVGIESLCLPLHDPKTNRQEVLKRLKHNLDAPRLRVGNEKMAQLQELGGLRTQLGGYAAALHERRQPMALSIYEAYEMLFAMPETPSVPLELPDILSSSRADMNRMTLEITAYEHFRDSLGEKWFAGPWLGVRKNILTNTRKQELRAEITALAEELRGHCSFRVGNTELGRVLSWAELADYTAVGRKIAAGLEIPARLVLPGAAEDNVMLSRLGISSDTPEDVVSGCAAGRRELLAALEKTESLLTEADIPASEIGWAQLFRVVTLLAAHGLNGESIGLTDSYFSAQGLSAVEDLLRERVGVQDPAEGTASGDTLFAAMDESEFFFACELFDEARQWAGETSAEADQWFSDYAPLLEQYTGGSAISRQTEYWEELLSRARAYRNGDTRKVTGNAEESYLADSAVLGRHYLLSGTDTEIIEKNIAFARELLSVTDGRPGESIRRLLLAADKIDLDALAASVTGLAANDALRDTAEKDIRTAVLAAAEELAELEKWQRDRDGAREIETIASGIRAIVYDGERLRYDRDILAGMLESGSERLYDIMDELAALETLRPRLEGFLSLYQQPERLAALPLDTLRARMEACVGAFEDYDTMVECQTCIDSCHADGLDAFLESAIAVRKEPGTLGRIFEKAFLTRWIDAAAESEESISTFTAFGEENRIESYRKLDEKQLAIARERVRAAAVERMPRRASGKVVGEMGILLREFSRNRNPLTIRQLFDNIPNLLMKLTPCLMMSPLSVAYFLKADLYDFDTVIFDEASQIFPENAMGAILRGRQAVIAGDSKQMPPTSFFQTTVNTDEEDEELDNSDSILEEAENVLPNLSLTWHYRSKNEDLITFSNRNMYSGSLVTFPNSAPHTADSGVELEYVPDALYEDRKNTAEAERCLALAKRHFETHPERSLGIIAFSISQEEAIAEVFERFRTDHPEFEEYFDENRPEPFFIKNLENVQGDERDTIILSVGYAKNRQGILRYNFGPLGMQGGERRMNVAITRAKQNIKLVCSLRPEDFDKEKIVQNAGAKLLYDYITYAAQGPRRDYAGMETGAKEGFRQYLRDTLAEAGFKTATNIGSSGYRVEIAVEDPARPGTYIAGIETDGRSYSQGRTVRDRELLRPGMLRSMGWNMIRVWSTQWYRDPETEKKKLIKQIRKLTERQAVQ